MAFKASIQGLSETLRKIEKYNTQLAVDIDGQLTVAANNVANAARLRAPKGKTGLLTASIRTDTSVKYSKKVEVAHFVAPYVEFGTGVKVFQNPVFNFTPEMRAYAREFYVSGKGRQPAQPYLFPSLEAEKPKLLNRIKEVLFKPTTI